MSTIYRKIGNASVHPIGFGAMGISKPCEPDGAEEELHKLGAINDYGAVGTDEERLHVSGTSSAQ